MAIMDVFQGMPAEVMQNHLSEQRKYLVQLELDHDSLEYDLKLYRFEGYSEFKSVLLEAEKKRLAFLRMEVHTSEISQHDSLQGQWNQCEVLSRRKEEIEQTLAILKLKIAEVQKKISSMTQKLVAKINKEK